MKHINILRKYYNRKQLPNKFRIDQATNYLAVFWALLELNERKLSHRQSNIQDLLPLDANTIRHALKFLEIHGAIKHKRKQGQRRGARNTIFKLNPYKIPKLVYQTRMSRLTERRQNDKMEKGRLLKYKSSSLFFDPKGFIDLLYSNGMQDKFVETTRNQVRDLCRRHGKPIPALKTKESVEQWFIDNLDSEEWEDQSDFLEKFQNYICWKYEKWQSDTNKS